MKKYYDPSRGILLSYGILAFRAFAARNLPEFTMRRVGKNWWQIEQRVQF